MPAANSSMISEQVPQKPTMGEYAHSEMTNSAEMGESKGEGFSGPKRWTGRDPPPARHIPWPEIIKHHISVIEGHMKMLEMVRKHTAPETGNYRTMTEFVDRAKEMLHHSKQTQRIFVLPNQIDQVPLGSSSVSRYPSYSPADYEHSKAAEEHGRAAAATRAQDIDFKPAGMNCEIGQGKGVKRQSLAEKRAVQSTKNSGSGSGTGSGSDRGATKAATNGQANHDKPAKGDVEGYNPVFFVDTQPTPVNLPGVPHRPSKRESSPPEPIEAKKAKKQKQKHIGDLAANIELEDISAEVDARMKEKEEKRKRKEKKRKRDIEGSSLVVEEPSAAADVEKPKKKKPKKADGDVPADGIASRKRQGEDGEEAGNGEAKAKKKRKKAQGEAADAKGL